MRWYGMIWFELYTCRLWASQFWDVTAPFNAPGGKSFGRVEGLLSCRESQNLLGAGKAAYGAASNLKLDWTSCV